ncbi:isoprenyl transferase [Wukongibacter baidiensis]|uniref:isoprenyl transferase n=1 Tax=Wukongibacter baidiensis TaxID=1723361 RepID=UPI003D7F46C0
MFMKTKKSNSSETIKEIDEGSKPKHIAIIMDGNGRWARKRGLPRIAGHKAGVEALRDVIKCASDIGVQYLTLYAFSTENWNRPDEEVNGLMELLVLYLRKEIKDLHRNKVKINTIGDITRLPVKAVKEIEKAMLLTGENTGLTVNIALNYGARSEILNAVKNICRDVSNNALNIEDIDENTISQHLYTKAIPDPDLLIRTSGEQRISNFLLWQIAYSELYFTEVYWPDFKPDHLVEAIIEFGQRQRRFGGL